MHDVSDKQFALAKQLGIRLVRHTVYWYTIEKTDAPGVYDEEALRSYDDVDCAFDTTARTITIRDVEIDSLVPTVIPLRPVE